VDLEEFSERITESIEGLSSYIQALEEFVSGRQLFKSLTMINNRIQG